MTIQTIFVVGAGLMGTGIAQTAITNGYHVIIFDQNEAATDRAKNAIERALKREVEKDRITQEDCRAALERLSVSTDMAAAQNADLVIEAIYEDLEAKQAVFAQLEDVCPPRTIFASNTSSISLTALASVTKRPDRVVGMHFFSPVPKMRLCEVVFGLRTDQDVLHEIKVVGEKLGKTMILSDDKPGFIVNRALVPMLNEACFMCGTRVGTVEDIDTGLKLGCNHPMGPLELADMIGLDVMLNVMKVLEHEYGEKYRPSLTLRKMVRAGFLGRKSGAGFYLYEDGKKTGVNPALTKVRTLE